MWLPSTNQSYSSFDDNLELSLWVLVHHRFVGSASTIHFAEYVLYLRCSSIMEGYYQSICNASFHCLSLFFLLLCRCMGISNIYKRTSFCTMHPKIGVSPISTWEKFHSVFGYLPVNTSSSPPPMIRTRKENLFWEYFQRKEIFQSKPIGMLSVF